MLLPSNFKDTISKTFYDKTIEVITRTEVTEVDGGRGDTLTAVVSSFKGNIRFAKLGEIIDDSGLKYEADALITCPTDTVLVVQDVVRYVNRDYFVKSILPFDSHLKILVNIWQAHQS